ncbi:glycosyltransferase family 4 protein [Eleftheria terrae]|uniref:glycosyltransferase family 4 protein n=1 Tax=Eleftheria terrae TaxID=1597781 RepID=UPI00263A7B75|nr:glycosyltransferase family 4 protein [Eleftheria terrae]WKB55303.1 glycosyltransferase family 4 protein [Eleftheria terrae]
MRIAQVAPLAESVPPQGYGGTERVVSYLTEALVDQGHEVTLFASGDSITSADLVPITRQGLRTSPEVCNPAVWHTIMLDKVSRRASDFDVIHFHVDCTHYAMARRCATPCLTTLHGRLDAADVAVLHDHFTEHPVVAISGAQRASLPDANWMATIHHGLPQKLYDFHPLGQDYFAFVGRISPEKRLDRAIEIAVACNTPLWVAAKIDPCDQAYFDTEIRALMRHPLVHFVDEIDEVQKNDFIGNARALLFPIDWPEPFGLVMVEAMACGVPVIAYACGSVPEVMEHGLTGFVVSNQEQAIDAARRVQSIDRSACRRVFERRYLSSIMADEYGKVYRRLAADRGTSHDTAGTSRGTLAASVARSAPAADRRARSRLALVKRPDEPQATPLDPAWPPPG